VSITLNQLRIVARARVGNKLDQSVGEHQIPDKAIDSEISEHIAECCRLLGASTARVEAWFQTRIPQAMAQPAAPTLVPSTTGGFLAAGTYSYRISAIRGVGETAAGVAAQATVGAGGAGSVAISWSPIAGATSYGIYGRTAGSECQLAMVPAALTGWTDSGLAQPGTAAPTSDTSTGSGYLQDYDVQTYIGTDVLEIEEVIRSASFQTDAFLESYMVDPRTGIPTVKVGGFIDQAYQENALELIQQQERFRRTDEYMWESVMINGRLHVRLMPPPESVEQVRVVYVSTSASLATLPEQARIPLEHAACAAILNGIISRTISDPMELHENSLDRRAHLEVLTKQRDYYDQKYRAALNKIAPIR
jgi:hypothetical protein